MRDVPRGLVESKTRQQLARTLMQSGPRTARGLTKDMTRSPACLRYHLRVLSVAGAVAPCLDSPTGGDEAAYSLRPEGLPEWAREVLLGEISLQTAARLMDVLLSEGPRDTGELADRLGLSRPEVARYMRTLRPKGQQGDIPRLETGNLPDRVSDYDAEWVAGWFENPREEEDDSGSREGGAE